ncbi:hypothetical protein FHS35_006820 [Streptomyces umbrinus]|uniref:DUF6081 family protein n=1 Tax=Streptomyces umbrinus TaxID=67370 RepID=UPI0019C886B7|nr:DUF6081 family protein [Streptomyces umbrinus]MCR3729935.1 hypothetical protein [Streptomyces umbrinus]GHB26402.1 hypothetical protein GCM10010306_019800 [Streptomyces umbrinus]GHH40082.1 hypothetical protein GCM10018775_21690 [Streptomyces umbrinus]
MRHKVAYAVVAAAAVVALLPATAQSAPTASRAGAGGGTVLFQDTYGNGFTTGENGNWLLQGDAEWPTGDAVVTTPGGVLNVVPTGVNPKTGDPAYARSTGPDGGADSDDHIKWIAFPNRFTAENVPGFEVPDTGSISCVHKVAGRTFGTENPFGSTVKDPASDIRLASIALITADFESRAIADFSVTNDTIYAIYERLPSDTEDYASYGYAIPLAKTAPGAMHELEVRLDQSGKRVTWFVDGRQKLQTDKIGTRAFDRKYMTLDHGGTEERVELDQITCGMGLGSLLDGAKPGAADGGALVRLKHKEGFYFDPRRGEPVAQKFFDPESKVENRLFGQGSEIRADWTKVIRRP